MPGLDVGVVYEAAGEGASVGGDFYDLFPIGGGSWCFVVGDVCGAGAEAAAVTGLARHTIRSLTRAGFPVAATLERLNAAILDEGERARFLTLVCGIFPQGQGRLHLTMVNAGHPALFVAGVDGQVRRMGRPQLLLGVMDRVEYVAEEHVLERGELLVALTDGVLERRSGGRMLDDDGVADELARVGGAPGAGGRRAPPPARGRLRRRGAQRRHGDPRPPGRVVGPRRRAAPDESGLRLVAGPCVDWHVTVDVAIAVG